LIEVSKMLKTTIGAAVAGATAVAAVSAPAVAAGPYVIRTGTNATAAKVNITGGTITDARITAKKIDFVTSTGLRLGCGGGTAAGWIKRGRDADGVGVGSITRSSWSNCIGPAGLKMRVRQLQAWRLNFVGAPGRTTRSYLDTIKARVVDSSTGGNQCSAIVTGTVSGQFNSPSQVLQINGGPLRAKAPLRFSNVNGCFGAIKNGQTARFYAKYKIKNATAKPITIRAR
jgi:hypothetical protein